MNTTLLQKTTYFEHENAHFYRKNWKNFNTKSALFISDLIERWRSIGVDNGIFIE